MLELIVNQKQNTKETVIALVENGKLLEQYEENEESNRREGNIYVGKVKDIVKGMQSAFIDIGTEKNAFIHLKDILPKANQATGEEQDEISIEKVIKNDDKLLVQVKKDSNDKKGARVSTHISLPSRYVVLMPNTNIITISQKIEDETERERLLKLVEENLPKGYGLIIRTSAQGKTEELVEDIKEILKEWEQIEKKYKENDKKEPGLIYQAFDVSQKIIIDLGEKALNQITVNTKPEYERLKKFLESKKQYQQIPIQISNGNLLEKYDIENQIEKSKSRKIWLNCGGFITIDKTEALIAIDVNTGKYTGTKDLEETIYRVNREATIEIAKQLRLRDIGGIIIIDYIDMKLEENKERIEKILIEELKKDRAKTQVEGFTKLDLMEMTRKHICSHQD